MHDDVDADRIAAENARNKAELWANGAVDVPVEIGKFSSMHWATKASAFNSLAQGYATTASEKATEANQSAINAGNSATTAGGHASTANQRAIDADSSAGVALNHANTAAGHKDLAYDYKEEAKAYRDQAGAIVGGDFVPKTTTINGFPLNNNIVLNAGHVGAQPVDADLTAIGALAGLTGLLRKTAENTWTLDTATYLTSVPAQSWTSITDKPVVLTTLSGVTGAADQYIYFTGSNTATTGTVTTFGRSLIDDVDASAARTTLGLGTAATQASTAFQAANAALTTFGTNIAAAGAGIFKKTAANTWTFATLVEADIPSLNVSKLTAGTLSVARGGTGVATLTGIAFGNGTGAFTVATAAQIVAAINSTAVANATAAVTATRLFTPRTINGVTFDGSADIIIPAPGSVATADALTTARAITITGDADWTVNFKGDAAVSAALTLKPVVTAGTGTKLTYNAKGLITGSSALLETDIPNLAWSKITSGVPSFALTTDVRFTDSREWNAPTGTLADITGANTTRKAYTGDVLKAAIEQLSTSQADLDDIEALAIIGMMR
jgi:hypothetical protein